MRLNLNPDSLILAIDVGSSSVRTTLFDSQVKPLERIQSVPSIQTPYRSETTADGGVTIDPTLLSNLIFEGIDSVVAKNKTGRITVVAMDTFVGNLVGLDSKGQPTTPVYTWADSRGGVIGLDLGSDYTERTGCRLHTSYWPLRLVWLQQNRPDEFARTRYWTTIGAYVFAQLLGVQQISISAASWSGLLNRHTLDWDAQTLAALPIQRDQLFAISNEPITGLHGDYVQRWPSLSDAAWFPAVADGVASNIGNGCTTSDHVALSMGTSGALRVIVPDRPEKVPEGLFAYRVDAHRSIVGGALSNVGNLYAWLETFLAITPETAQKLADLAPDSHGLTILPFLVNERAPSWDDKARAAFIGMTLNTKPEHLLRASMEAVAYRFYEVADRLPKAPSFVASGAAISKSPLWAQIMADVLGVSVLVSNDSEATIRGAVFAAIGVEPEIPPHTRYEPDMKNHQIYRAAIDRQRDLYQRLR